MAGAIIYSDQQVLPGYNGTGSDIAKGVIVKLKVAPSQNFEVEIEATSTGVIYGVTQNIIENGRTGDIVVGGVAEVLAGGTITPGVRVMPTTGGKSLTATAGNSVLGIALTTGTASALHNVVLSAPGGAEMPG